MRRDKKDAIINGKIEVRFNWDAFPRQYSGGLFGGLFGDSTSVDCDARAVFCDAEGVPVSPHNREACLSYLDPDMYDGAALHHGDNQTGHGKDDETISLDLTAIPPEVGRILLTMDLFKEKKSIGFGRIQNSSIRILRAGSHEELGRSEFKDLGLDVNLVAGGVLRREKKGWSFIQKKDSYKLEDMDAFLAQLAEKKR